MYELNKVVVAGRLARDPEIRYTQGEKSLCCANLTLAVNRHGRDSNADFINCAVFGKSGEFVEKYLRKGSPAMIEGRIQTRNYTNKEGVKVYVTEVIGDRITSAKEGNANWNTVEIAGRLTKDPDVRTSVDARVTRFTLACKRRAVDEADFINCVAFGKTGETAEKYLCKGKGIVLRGRIQTGSYTNKGGVKVYTTDVVCDDFGFLYTAASENAAAQAPGQEAPEQSAPVTQSAPQAQAAPVPAQQPAQPQPAASPAAAAPDEEENLFTELGLEPIDPAGLDGLDEFMAIPEGDDEELPFN